MRMLHTATMVALAAVLAMGACGQPEPDGSPSGGADAIGAGATPSAGESQVPSPEVQPTPAPSAVTQPTAKPEPAPENPTTARKYAEAVVSAWQQDKIDVLGDLATPGVQEQIIEIPGPIDMDWTFTRCDGAAGSSYCLFTNAVGDVLILRISNSLLGQAHAATEVRLDAKA